MVLNRPCTFLDYTKRQALSRPVLYKIRPVLI